MKWHYLAIAILILSIAVGYFFPHGEETFEQSPVYEMIKHYGEIYKPYNPSTVIFLFLKNSITLSIAFFLSPIFLIPPTLILLINGFMTGFVAAALPLDFAIKALAPHGVFELSALVLAAAGGMNFGFCAFMKILKKRCSVVKSFREGLLFFASGLVLLLIAAIIETYLTPFILGI